MAAWIDLVCDDTGQYLVDTGRLEEIVQGMSHPKSQYPSFISFIGNGSRMKALKALFPYNNITRNGPAGLVRLHLSTTTAHTEHPVIFVESGLSVPTGLGDTESLKHSADKHRRFPISRGNHLLVPLQQQVISELVLPWTHILCLFVSTVGEIKNLQKLLGRPRGKLLIGTYPMAQVMRIVIVLTGNTTAPNSDFIELSDNELKEGFSGLNLTVLDLRGRFDLSPPAAYEPLRRLVLNEIHEIRIELSNHQLLFSASHLNALWSQHVQLGAGDTYLDCLMAARKNFPPTPAIVDCLMEFVSQAREVSCPSAEIYYFVASALLMDAYPAGMHHFKPEYVFNFLYLNSCTAVWNSQQDFDSDSSCQGLLAQFCEAFFEMSQTKSSSSIRRGALLRYRDRWGELRSTTTCFFCMCRPPEHMLSCRHSICDTCVVLVGSPSGRGEYHTDIHNCPICEQQSQITIRRLPPTKHPVVFSMDGGGIRGIIQLGLLWALQRRLGTGVSVAHIPDLWAGTSFPGLARMIFEPPSKRMQNSILARCTNWLRLLGGFMADSHYDSDNLDDILKKAVDPDRRIFDVPTAKSTGCRVVIITSRVSDGRACVWANYRGIGRRNTRAAYLFLTPRTESQNPLLCDVARCAVAAPFIFRTKSLPGFGLFQDGGVRANNPLAIALKESSIVWPSAKKPDLILSVGTGFCESTNESDTHPRIFQDRAIARMIRATVCSPSSDGNQGFYEALNCIPHHMKDDLFRLDQALPCPLPRLDDVAALARLAKLQFTVSDELVRAVLVTAFFFFELDEVPVKRHGEFDCQGSILCTRSDAKPLLNRVIIEFPGARVQTTRGHDLGSISEDDGCRICGYYRKKVRFSVSSLEEMISVVIASSTHQQRIGGFPKSMQDFLKNQQAHAQFGRPDHLIASWPPARICFCFRGKKRRIQILEPSFRQTKRRL
ncbi:unnamed protein product [Penicillium salamii]|uniref:Uncharacterized protein n=1 Tax=Penicillium salamii TaxID=1612424 RepID=A0A9W4N6Q9_9EURO|nr:unnamed protein product [Penicillium salamii]